MNGGRNTALGRGFESYAQLERDKEKLQLKYYDYHLFAYAPFSSPTINITDYYSSRLTPASFPRGQADPIVWAFGGSTMQDFETTDDLSIANTIAKSLAKVDLKPRVENFGVSAFQSSLEFVKFTRLLTTVPASERPGIILFYDGFNDAVHAFLFGAGVIQSDLSTKLAALVEGRSGNAAAYNLSKLLARYLSLWQIFHRTLEHRMARVKCDSSNENLDRAVSIYLNNVSMTEAICSSFGIKCFFVLQPLVLTKQPLGPIDQASLASVDQSLAAFVRGFYSRIRGKLADRPSFIDASQVLDNDQQDDFWDIGHTGPFTQSIIGQAIADRMIQRMGH